MGLCSFTFQQWGRNAQCSPCQEVFVSGHLSLQSHLHRFQSSTLVTTDSPTYPVEFQQGAVLPMEDRIYTKLCERLPLEGRQEENHLTGYGIT